jgi:hypothetical protein
VVGKTANTNTIGATTRDYFSSPAHSLQNRLRTDGIARY